MSQAPWQALVIPATWEAEAGESLEHRSRGCSKLRLHYCTPAWGTEQDCVSKKEKKRTQSTGYPDTMESSGISVLCHQPSVSELGWPQKPDELSQKSIAVMEFRRNISFLLRIFLNHL